MNDLIAISTLNDFIFCPYSIYLHNVYMDTDEDMYHAKPQTRGRNAHEKIDDKKTSTRSDIIESLPILSHEFGVYGKIDVYNQINKRLIERKYALKKIYRGLYYQLWAQYYCLLEMGYQVDNIAFYEISSHKTINVPLPSEEEKTELKRFIHQYKFYNPKSSISVNPNKCTHCIYCNSTEKLEKHSISSNSRKHIS